MAQWLTIQDWSFGKRRGKFAWMREVRTNDVGTYGYHRTWQDAMDHATHMAWRQGTRWTVTKLEVKPRWARHEGYRWVARKVRR